VRIVAVLCEWLDEASRVLYEYQYEYQYEYHKHVTRPADQAQKLAEHWRVTTGELCSAAVSIRR